MAQTKLNFAIKKADSQQSGSDTPGSQTDGTTSGGTNTGNTGNISNTGTNGDNIVTKTSSSDQTTDQKADQTTTTDKDPKLTSANTGLLTQDFSLSSSETTELVFCSIFFVGVIILCSLLIKLKKNRKAGFKKSQASGSNLNRAFGVLSILMMVVGFGGMMIKLSNSSASDFGEEGILTSKNITAELVKSTNDYSLYCATDEVKTTATDFGYYLFMNAEDNGVLTSKSTGISNISSAEDWDDLAIGTWGYYVGDLQDNVYNPLPLGESVISNIDDKTATRTTPVTFCAKVSSNVETANFTSTVNYSFVAREEEDFYPAIDFNSKDDDDGDGLKNREENRYGLNPLSSDSDMDSLSDYAELKTHHTDPLKKDTDEDGLFDYSEIALNKDYGTDPLNPKSCNDSSCDSTKLDGEQTYSYSEAAGETTDFAFTIEGKGNVPLTYISAVDPTDVDESLNDLTGKRTSSIIIENIL